MTSFSSEYERELAAVRERSLAAQAALVSIDLSVAQTFIPTNRCAQTIELLLA